MPTTNNPIITIEEYEALTDAEKDVQDKKMLLYIVGKEYVAKYQSMTIDALLREAFPDMSIEVSRYIIRKYYAAESASLNPDRPPSVY